MEEIKSMYFFACQQSKTKIGRKEDKPCTVQIDSTIFFKGVTRLGREKGKKKKRKQKKNHH